MNWDEDEAEQLLKDVKARRALWEFLWKAAHDHEKGRPFPTAPSDEFVQRELRRILLPRKKFLGIF